MVLTSNSYQPLIILPDMKADFLLLLPKLETALGTSRWQAWDARAESWAANRSPRPPHLGTIFCTVRSGFLKILLQKEKPLVF